MKDKKPGFLVQTLGGGAGVPTKIMIRPTSVFPVLPHTRFLSDKTYFEKESFFTNSSFVKKFIIHKSLDKISLEN